MNTRQFWAVMIPQLVIAIIFCAIFAASVWFVFTTDISEWTETQEKIAIYLLGILSSGLLMILGYFFSSSVGSKIKGLTDKGGDNV